MYPALIQGLRQASAYPHEITVVRIIETHISWLLLTGRYVYKIKKPVHFGFLDFSTLERRHFFCQEEIRLNRRLAADLYLEVVPITGSPELPKIGNAGQAIEYAVKMRQFPSGALLSERAECAQLETEEIEQIAGKVADFHEGIASAGADSAYGSADNIKHWFDENFDHIRPLLNNDQHRLQLQAIQAWSDKQWLHNAACMQLRKQQGYVRECHGDLHLSNMTLINGQVTLFDCIEFNPELRWIDVISEIAFLMIDLLHSGYESYAFRLLNRYLQHTGDYSGLALLHYYLVYRALVLAKVALLRGTQQGVNTHGQKYIAFARLAERFTQTGRVALIITHGYSGSGKSTWAIQLAEKTGAVQIRSDVERKRLFARQALENTGSGINQGLYTPEAGEQTYAHLAKLAKIVMDSGFTAIIDATFLKSEQRTLFWQLATDCCVPFVIVDFQASESELSRRIQQRKQQRNDPSEATLSVLQQQLHTAEILSADEQAYVLSVDTECDAVLEKLVANLPDYWH
jgi:uncharacterized protein